MIRGLTTIAIGGALLCVIGIGASGALSRHSWRVPSMDWNFGDSDGPAVRLTGNEKTASRDLPWSGGEALTFDLPAKVTFTQGPVAKITLTGPDGLIDHVVLVENRLKLDRSIHGINLHNALAIAITAPALHDFRLDSALSLDIHNLATDQLRVAIDGAGKVTANGTAQSLKLEIDGAGDADLGGLTLADASIEIDGLGHVVAGPTGDAKIRIDGAGKVSLTKRPAHLNQQIDGAGSVTQPDGPVEQKL